MTYTARLRLLLGALSLCGIPYASAAKRWAPQSPGKIELHRLSNGLRVVLSPDASVPIAHVGVYYRVGPREEPPGRDGFAHLFEHLMFEGSPSLKAGEYFSMVVSSGGRFGARTLYDLTKYNAAVPAHALERQLWAEADRMRAFRVDSARFGAAREVVKNEVRQQAFNRPYGRFVWIDVFEVAQTKWVNAHSIYGDEPGGTMAALDSATLGDAHRFYDSYYTPDNAVLVVAGDFDPRQALAWVQRYFGDIRRTAVHPSLDQNEPRQTSERRATRVDRNAPRPALAVAYHMPPRRATDFWTMQVIDQILIEGRDSWLQRELIQRRALVDGVYGGVSARHGSVYTTGGPNFWTTYVFLDSTTSRDTVLAAIDRQIERLRTTPVDSATLAGAILKARADFAQELTADRGDGRADLLGQFTLFDGDPRRIDEMDQVFRSVTREAVLATAREYLRPTNRTVLHLLTTQPR